MNAYKDRVAETEGDKERKRARVWRGAGDVPMEPWYEERMAGRHAVASGEEEKQHEENIMRDIHIAKKGSETATEEQPGKLRKTVRFEKEAPSSSSCMHVSLDYLASGERQDHRSVSLCRIQVMLTMTHTHFCVGCVLRDGWTRQSLHHRSVRWYREADAGDLRRSELNELDESMTCLNALERKKWLETCEK